MVVSLITLSHDLTKGSAEALELIGTARRPLRPRYSRIPPPA